MSNRMKLLLCFLLPAILPVTWVYGHAGHKHADVVWPAARSLDALSNEVRYLADGKDFDGLRGSVPLVRAAIAELAGGSIPKKVRNPLVVRLAVDDLKAFGKGLAGAEDLEDAVLLKRAKKLAPLVDDFIDAAQVGVVQGHGPHDGELAPVIDAEGKTVGRVELKLHDDKGDLELWISSADGKTPLDLPLGAVIRVDFLDKKTKQVALKVRNSVRNEDEDGMPNIRAGKTNYYIFPGDTGEDATWLMGKSFKAMVRVSFLQGETNLRSIAFHLSPHGGADHSH